MRRWPGSHSLLCRTRCVLSSGNEPNGEVELPGAKISISSSSTGSWQKLESDGHTIQYHVDYVVGSGKHASGYLVSIRSHLFQSPIAYYRSRHGYVIWQRRDTKDRQTLTSNGRLTPGCLFWVIQDAPNQWQEPKTSISLLHFLPIWPSVAAAATDQPKPIWRVQARRQSSTPQGFKARRGTVYANSATFLGVAQVLNPGKRSSDFRPGTSLEDTYTCSTSTSSCRRGTASKFKGDQPCGAILALSMCSRKKQRAIVVQYLPRSASRSRSAGGVLSIKVPVVPHGSVSGNSSICQQRTVSVVTCRSVTQRTAVTPAFTGPSHTKRQSEPERSIMEDIPTSQPLA